MSKAQDQRQCSAGGGRAAARTLMLAIAACLALLALPGVAAASDPFGDLTGSSAGGLGSPTISSDKADYAPGETVVLTGDNWLPGEHVHITVNDNVGQTWVRESDVNADASGSIRDEFQLPSSFVAEYAVTATGDASGTARTSFTDGNVKINLTPNGVTADIRERIYDKSANCTDPVKKDTTVTITSPATDTVGIGNNESVRLDAPSPATTGQTFINWTKPAGSTLVFTVIGGTDGKSVCVQGFQNGTADIIANYAANTAPTVAANNASVSVNEGQTATNTGTWADANAGDTVTLSASVGTVTKNANGTWSWSYDTTDGPAQSQNVTITATDNHGASNSTTFAVTVNNKAPVVSLSGPVSADEGDTKSYSYSWTDAGADDTFPASGNSVSCGPKGAASAVVFTPAAKTGSFDCTFSDDSGAGTFEVKATVGDDDLGSGSDSKLVAVANVAPTASNGTFVVDPVFGTATAGFDFSDVGFGDTHSSSYFSWSDVGNRVATVTETNGTGHASDVRTLGPGCYELTVTGTAKDDDGATSAPPLVLHSGAQTSVYGKAFRPPIVDNERNIAKYGNVVPVKVILTNTCTGATVTNVPLFVTIHLGTGGETFDETPAFITESVSSADSGSQMRTADGMYIYNLSTRSMQAGKDYAIRIRPNSTTAPWILQAVLYPKK
jgi:hypothetical protein